MRKVRVKFMPSKHMGTQIDIHLTMVHYTEYSNIRLHGQVYIFVEV